MAVTGLDDSPVDLNEAFQVIMKPVDHPRTEHLDAVMLQSMRIYLVIVCFALGSARGFGGETNSTKTNWRVYFSPRGGCTEAVVAALSLAKTTVLVQAYSFTSAPIAAALVDAHRRGVNVQVILDKSQRTEKYSSATFIRNYGIACYIDSQHAIAHNKVMVLDGKTVLTGSFNFTKAAEEKNAENLLILQDAELALKYTFNWAAHRQHSTLYAGLREKSKSPKRNRPGR
jgi:phosphatidylserine/phosphatidylglycerophosphate/cardiolipin synthase-like enzyme